MRPLAVDLIQRMTIELETLGALDETVQLLLRDREDLRRHVGTGGVEVVGERRGAVGESLIGAVGAVFVHAHGGVDKEPAPDFGGLVTNLDCLEQNRAGLSKASLKGADIWKERGDAREVLFPLGIGGVDAREIPSKLLRDVAAFGQRFHGGHAISLTGRKISPAVISPWRARLASREHLEGTDGVSDAEHAHLYRSAARLLGWAICLVCTISLSGQAWMSMLWSTWIWSIAVAVRSGRHG